MTRNPLRSPLRIAAGKRDNLCRRSGADDGVGPMAREVLLHPQSPEVSSMMIRSETDPAADDTLSVAPALDKVLLIVLFGIVAVIFGMLACTLAAAPGNVLGVLRR